MVQAIAEFKKPFIFSSRFEFVRKNIKQIMLSLQDKNEPPMFTFIDYLHHNRAYDEAMQELNRNLVGFIDSHTDRLKTFEPFLDLYKEYSPKKAMPDLIYHDVEACIEQLL